MSKEDTVLIGLGGHASSGIDVIEQEGKYRVAGSIVKASEVAGSRIGHKVLATDEELHLLAKSFKYALVTIGRIATALRRMHLYRMAQQLGFRLPTIILISKMPQQKLLTARPAPPRPDESAGNPLRFPRL